MADAAATLALRTAHERLLDILSDLDAAGESGAGAHIAAAIDLIESRIEPDPRLRRRRDEDGAIATIAREMVSAFGPRAQRVARGQMDGASGSAFLSWAAIISRMDD